MIRMEGLGRVEKSLVKLARKKEQQFERGLLEAGLMIQHEAQKITPVDTGALRASAYTRLIVQDVSFARKLLNLFSSNIQLHRNVEVGYSQWYAIYVHENVGAFFKVGQAKFLETAIRNHREAALAIIRRRLRE